MSAKTETVKALKQHIKGLEEELSLAVEACRICRLCTHRDADCSPTDYSCKPKWRGKQC